MGAKRELNMPPHFLLHLELHQIKAVKISLGTPISRDSSLVLPDFMKTGHCHFCHCQNWKIMLA